MIPLSLSREQAFSSSGKFSKERKALRSLSFLLFFFFGVFLVFFFFFFSFLFLFVRKRKMESLVDDFFLSSHLSASLPRGICFMNFGEFRY